MDIRLKDGSGQGFVAKVDDRLRMHVDSVVRTQSQEAALLGEAYNISTGTITLTSGNESALLYIKNTSETPLVIKEVGFRAGATTGGSGSALLKLYANGDAGTIISGASAPTTNFNRNLGSAKSITGSVFKGAEGNTLTGGENAAVSSTDNFTDALVFDAEIFVLPKGTSMGALFTPPSGNTSQNVVVFATVFYEGADLSAEQ